MKLIIPIIWKYSVDSWKYRTREKTVLVKESVECKNSGKVRNYKTLLCVLCNINKTCPCNGTPLQYSCLENPMDTGVWWAAVHGVAKSQTRLSDFPFTFHFHALEREMVTHSSVLAWRIPGTVEPGGLQSMESHRVGHD